MNKHYLKILRDNLPGPLKCLAAPVIRRGLINNKEFLHYYNLLLERESLTTEEIKEYQFIQLKQILIHSFLNVPYYQELFNKVSFDPYKLSEFEQINKIPFLTRELVNANYEKLISKEKVKNGYYIGQTGGSSSVPLKFLLDFDSIYRENAFIYYFRKRLGYELKDKIVAFRQIEYGSKLWKLHPMYNELIFFPIKISKKTIEDYARKINSFKPQYLNGYLSAIWYFVKLLDEYQIKLKFKLKGIFLTSENIDSSQRQYIEQYFDAKSMTFYGHSERCVIAEEIDPNGYIFDPYYGYTEKVLNENNTHSIVGTGFLNYSMPFIRYKTDDICIQEGENYRIEGKRNSTVGLVGINNEFIATTALELDDPVFSKITTYQFIQHEKGEADLHIIVSNDFAMEDLELITKEINKQTNGIIAIKIKIVENLKLSPRGKYQMYISNIRKE